MKVSELGEVGLITLISKMVRVAQDKKAEAWRQLVLGIGDDAAAWSTDSSIQLATVDALVQDVHFSLGMTSWEELGWKALAVNLSDIAAMGGSPRYALVSLALPDQTEVEDVLALYRGILGLAKKFEVAIIGGDTDSTPFLAITITVIGSASSAAHLLTRSAARPGDKIAVTGCLGGAAAGLEMLTRNLIFKPSVVTSLKKAFLQPYPRVTEGQVLVECGVKTAIDISDGLVADLKHICQASRVSARIETERVPIQPDVKANFSDRALEIALSGGEDYELLFTGNTEVIERVAVASSCPVTVIGEILAGKAGKVNLVDIQGKPVKLSRIGWEHFKQRKRQHE
jgi:thiamine-monophosphate kinase